MNRKSVVCLGLAVLLLFFCHRIWHLGPTHTDDAVWQVAARQGNPRIVSDWAISQGRVFAFVSGALIYLGTYLQGTALGDVLHIGSFVVFFVAFHGLLSIYFDSRLALLAAVLNLGLFALRWEGSIVTTYPLFSWTLGTLFAASVYLGWRYSRESSPWLLGLSFPLLFVSLNIHEGVSVLMAGLAVLAVLSNYWRAGTDIRSLLSRPWNRGFLWQLSGTVGVVGLYFVSYAAFRLAVPSQYAGNQLGSLNPVRVIPVLLSLSMSGSVISDLIVPYGVGFADAIAHDGYSVVYRPLRFLASQNHSAVAWLAGLIAAGQVYLLVAGSPPESTGAGARSGKLPFWPRVLVGAMIALLPVLPVSLVGKYQEHFRDLQVRSYAFTPLCHFGWAVVGAAVLCRWERTRSSVVEVLAKGALAGGVGVLCYCGTLKNDAIAADMRRETCRWAAVDQLATIVPQLERPITAAHVPRLHSGSWFTVMSPEYWSQYMEVRHRRSLRFENKLVSRNSLAAGLAYVDFLHARDTAQTVVLVAPLEIDSHTQQLVANEIAVSCPGSDPSARVEYLLTYQNLEGGLVVRRFSTLAPGRQGVRFCRGAGAVPSTIRISRQAEIYQLDVECGDRLAWGSPVRFNVGGTERAIEEVGVKWLRGDWHPPEAAGVWSSAALAEVWVPLGHASGEELSVSLLATTFAGAGFHDQPQTVTVRVGDRTVASRRFARGDGWQPLQFCLDSSELAEDGQLKISFHVDSVINPGQAGISTDQRNLGVCLRTLVVDRQARSRVPVASVPDDTSVDLR